MAIISPAYCTEAELRRFMSSQSVDLYADNDGDSVPDDEVINDAINTATEEINGYAGQRYSTSGLSGSVLVERWCVMLAAFYLSLVRGNDPSRMIESEVERIRDVLLPKVASGAYSLPGVSLKADLRPTMSNLRVDRRFRHSKIRVSRPNSTDAPTALTQDLSDDISVNE